MSLPSRFLVADLDADYSSAYAVDTGYIHCSRNDRAENHGTIASAIDPAMALLVLIPISW